MGRVTAGLPYADVVAAGNLRLALLVIPVVVVPAVVAHLIGKLRIGTLDEMAKAMESSGVPAWEATRVTANPAARGINDVGSVAALFVDEGWASRIAPGGRLTARATRKASINLSPQELEWLRTAVEGLLPGSVPRR